MADKSSILKAIRKLETETAIARNEFEAVAAKWSDNPSDALNVECSTLYRHWSKLHNALQNAHDERVRMRRSEKIG